MARNTLARDLMVRSFAVVGADQPVRDAMRAVIGEQSRPERPNAVAVVDAEGRYEGVLTSRLLVKSLLSLWMPKKSLRDDEALLESALLDLVAERSELRVHDALVRGLPTVAPGDRLLSLVEVVCDGQLEYVPVVEDGRLLGLVPVTAIFDAVSAIALTPEHEGIRMEDEGAP